MSTVKNQFTIGSELSKFNNLKEFFGKSENTPLDTNKIESGSINQFPFGISFDEKECIVIHKKKLSEKFGHKIVLEAFNLHDTPFGKKNTFVNISFPHLRNHDGKAELVMNTNQDQFTILEDISKSEIQSKNNDLEPSFAAIAEALAPISNDNRNELDDLMDLNHEQESEHKNSTEDLLIDLSSQTSNVNDNTDKSNLDLKSKTKYKK